MDKQSFSANKNSKALVTTMDGWFSKLPQLPTNAKELLVKIMPFIALIFGVLGVLGGLAGLGILTMFAPLAMFGGAQGAASFGGGFLVALILLVSSGLLLAAFPGTKAKKVIGWTLLFYSEIVSLVGSILSMNILSGVVVVLIGFYILFQIRSYYK